MFDGLTERLSTVFDRLGGRGVLSEKDVDEALREVRVALLEADVALSVARDFIAKAKERATGEEIVRSVRPADQVVKIVYDGLVETLGGDEQHFMRIGGLFDLRGFVHHVVVERGAPGGVEDQHVITAEPRGR